MLLVNLFCFFPGDSTFARITDFFAQLWIHSTATHCPTPVFTTATTAHATTSASSKSEQTGTSNPAVQRTDSSRNSAQHDCCNWKGNNMGRYTAQQLIQSSTVCCFLEPALQHVMTLASQICFGRKGKTEKLVKVNSLVTGSVHFVKV